MCQCSSRSILNGIGWSVGLINVRDIIKFIPLIYCVGYQTFIGEGSVHIDVFHFLVAGELRSPHTDNTRKSGETQDRARLACNIKTDTIICLVVNHESLTLRDRL